MSERLLEVKGLYFSYNGENVLEDITFSLNRGDFLGIIGPNGSGKSTLLKLITGLLKPNRGEIKLYTNRISYIPQKITSMSYNFPAIVEEIVSLGILHKRLIGRISKDDYELIERALDKVGMLDFKDKKLSQLSGGQQQRVHIARAIVGNPELLVLDEPTTGVDVVNQTKFYELLGYLNKEMKITIIIVSHDISTIAKEVTTMAYLDRRLQFIGNPRDFFKKILWPVEVEELLNR